MKYKIILTGAVLASAALMCSQASASNLSYATDFTKNNNIYTNLNEEFPHTDDGTGTPGSGVGAPNASFFFNPPPTGASNLQNDVNNGVGFQLTSDSAGHDFEQINSGEPLTIAIGVANATNVYALVGAYDGVNASVTFAGSGGATQTFSDFYIPDFNGGSINSVTPTLADQTVFQVQDVGAGGTGNSTTGSYNNYDLTELGFTLGSQFSGQTLTSATFTSDGYETLVLGLTTASSSDVSAAPEPSTWLLMIAGIGGIGLMLRQAKRTMEFRFKDAFAA